MQIFNLPDLGEGLPDAEINTWHVKVGDIVKADDPLVSMETAKAVVDVPSPHSGKILKLYGEPGDIIQDEEGNIIMDSSGVRKIGGNTPSHVVVAAGEFTTLGGDTDETIAITGLLATDIVLVNLHTAGATPVTIIDASASADQIDVDMSADPSTDHVLSYIVYRAVTTPVGVAS